MSRSLTDEELKSIRGESHFMSWLVGHGLNARELAARNGRGDITLNDDGTVTFQRYRKNRGKHLFTMDAAGRIGNDLLTEPVTVRPKPGHPFPVAM